VLCCCQEQETAGSESLAAEQLFSAWFTQLANRLDSDRYSESALNRLASPKRSYRLPDLMAAFCVKSSWLLIFKPAERSMTPRSWEGAGAHLLGAAGSRFLLIATHSVIHAPNT